MTDIRIPELSLVVLVGVTGSGKSTFAARHFRPTEVVSSDFFRALVGDDENDQSVTAAAFEALNAVAAQRLSLGRLTVIDATSLQPEARRPLVELARRHHLLRGPGASLGEQHHLHRHRLRVRRPADRAALPGTRTGVGTRPAGLLRAGPAPGGPRRGWDGPGAAGGRCG